MSQSFGERTRAVIAARGQLCVGIDPHAALLSVWGLSDDAAGAREFGLRVVDAAAAHVGIVKPQVSFFERFGSAGYAALEDVLSAARDAGLLVIADVKRGDIGTTMDAYAQAWLLPGSPLEVDAITVSPFLGVGASEGTFALAERHDKGAFVLAATSNPEASPVQHSRGDRGTSLSADIIAEVTARAGNRVPAGQWGSIGFVIGATIDWDAAGIAPFDPPAPILGPGFGQQGAGPADLVPRFGEMAPCVIASESRSLLSAGPEGLADAVRTRSHEYREVRGG